jgi:hypothetical protein
MTDTPKTSPLFIRREPTPAEAEQHVAAVWECPASAFEDPRDAQPVPIPETLNGASLSAEDRKVLAGLKPKDRATVLLVLENIPAFRSQWPWSISERLACSKPMMQTDSTPAVSLESSLSAADQKLLATLTPRERSIVLSVVRNNPPITVAKALADCRRG